MFRYIYPRCLDISTRVHRSKIVKCSSYESIRNVYFEKRDKKELGFVMESFLSRVERPMRKRVGQFMKKRISVRISSENSFLY